MNIGCFSFPFFLFLSSPPPPNRATLPFLPTLTPGVPWESRHRHRPDVLSVGVSVTVGFLSRQPPHKAQQPQGLQRKKDLPPLPQRKKKEELNPKAEQLSAMQLRHQSPVRDFMRKLKASVAMRGRP